MAAGRTRTGRPAAPSLFRPKFYLSRFLCFLFFRRLLDAVLSSFFRIASSWVS